MKWEMNLNAGFHGRLTIPLYLARFMYSNLFGVEVFHLLEEYIAQLRSLIVRQMLSV